MRKEKNYGKWIKLCLSALIPLMIGVFTVVTTMQQTKLSTLQREHDKEEAILLRKYSEHQADSVHKDNLFDVYLDDVSKLLMLDDEKRSLTIIRAKTLASLRQFDSERKKHLLLFLYDSELIYRSPEKISSWILNINDADFNGIYFQGTTENTCSFSYLHLYHVYLSNASFINCFIDRSVFSAATIYNTTFFRARLFRTNFRFALLDNSNFTEASFFQTIFIGASLAECNFTGSFWFNQTVDFTNANLTGAVISDEQLSKSIIDNAILPNGTWGPIRSGNLVVNGDAEQHVSLCFFIFVFGEHHY